MIFWNPGIPLLTKPLITTRRWDIFGHLKATSHQPTPGDQGAPMPQQCRPSLWVSDWRPGGCPRKTPKRWVSLNWCLKTLGIQSPSENGNGLAEEVIVHPNHHLTRWLDPYKNTYDKTKQVNIKTLQKSFGEKKNKSGHNSSIDFVITMTLDQDWKHYAKSVLYMPLSSSLGADWTQRKKGHGS